MHVVATVTTTGGRRVRSPETTRAMNTYAFPDRASSPHSTAAIGSAKRRRHDATAADREKRAGLTATAADPRRPPPPTRAFGITVDRRPELRSDCPLATKRTNDLRSWRQNLTP